MRARRNRPGITTRQSGSAQPSGTMVPRAGPAKPLARQTGPDLASPKPIQRGPANNHNPTPPRAPHVGVLGFLYRCGTRVQAPSPTADQDSGTRPHTAPETRASGRTAHHSRIASAPYLGLGESLRPNTQHLLSSKDDAPLIWRNVPAWEDLAVLGRKKGRL